MKFSHRSLGLVAAALFALLANSASAALTSYSQDFESLDHTSGTALGDDGWLVGANVFDPTGVTFLYNYFAFPAPNGTGAFSNVSEIGTSTPPAGNQGLVVFNDYNNGDHNVGNRIEAIVFQEQTIGAGDVGKVASFDFIAAPGDIGGATTANAFIKTLDPGAGFATTNFLTVDTTSLPAGNSAFNISLPIDGSLVGQIFQIGFSSTAANFDPSGVNYDNINLTVPEPGTLALAGLGFVGLLGARRKRVR